MAKKVLIGNTRQTTLQTEPMLPPKFLPIKTLLSARTHTLRPQHWNQLKVWRNKVNNTAGGKIFTNAIRRLKYKLPEWQIDVTGGALRPHKNSNLKQSLISTAENIGSGRMSQEMYDKIQSLDNNILNEMFEQGGEDLFTAAYVYEQAYDPEHPDRKLSRGNVEAMETFLNAYDDYVSSRDLWLAKR